MRISKIVKRTVVRSTALNLFVLLLNYSSFALTEEEKTSGLQEPSHQSHSTQAYRNTEGHIKPSKDLGTAKREIETCLRRMHEAIGATNRCANPTSSKQPVLKEPLENSIVSRKLGEKAYARRISGEPYVVIHLSRSGHAVNGHFCVKTAIQEDGTFKDTHLECDSVGIRALRGIDSISNSLFENGTDTLKVPNGTYAFVINEWGDLLVDYKNSASLDSSSATQGAHRQISLNRPVQFAGEVKFSHGEITEWNNQSGTYRFDESSRKVAIDHGFPADRYTGR